MTFVLASTAAPRPRMTSSAFNMDDSDDDNTTMNDVARVNAQLAKRRAADEAAVLAAANEDPSIYDYDGSYDTFKEAEIKTHQLSQPVIASKDAPGKFLLCLEYILKILLLLAFFIHSTLVHHLLILIFLL